MSIDLTRYLFECATFPPIEKHILTILCLISNKFHEVHLTVDQLVTYTGYSSKTIEKNLKKFRDNKTLIYTGKFNGKKNNIPVYRINLNNPLPGGDKLLTTESQDGYHPLPGFDITPSRTIPKDNKIKDNNKDNSNFSFPDPKPLKPPLPEETPEERKRRYEDGAGEEAIKNIRDILWGKVKDLKGAKNI